MESSDGGVVAHLLRHHAVVPTMVDQLVGLSQERVEGLAVPRELGRTESSSQKFQVSNKYCAKTS